MTFSTRERISHVARRLGFGVEPAIVEASATVEDAVTAALDLSAPAQPPPDLDPPLTMEQARAPEQAEIPYAYRLGRLVGGSRRIEERLTWFFSDHFATNVRKVGLPYLMYRQHLTIRSRAAASFADLLHAIAIDPAMLLYLDGAHNATERINDAAVRSRPCTFGSRRPTRDGDAGRSRSRHIGCAATRHRGARLGRLRHPRGPDQPT